MSGTNDASHVSDAQIAVRAHQRWVARGCPISDGTDDWFAARGELEAERRAASSPASAGHVVRRKRSHKSARAISTVR
jgi:hypothetical protein